MAFQHVLLPLCLENGIELLTPGSDSRLAKQAVPSSVLASSFLYLSSFCLSRSCSGFDGVKDTATVQDFPGNGEKAPSLSEETTGGPPSPSP